MTFACDLSGWLEKKVFNSKQYGRLNREQKDDLARRVSRFRNDMAMFAARAGDDSNAQIRADILTDYTNRLEFILSAAKHTSINPNATRGLLYFLAYDFGLEKQLLGLGDELTEPGRVRNLLNRARRIGQGEVHVALSNFYFLDRAREADIAVNKLAKEYRVDKDLMDIIKLEAYEIGYSPFAEQALKARSPGAVMYQRMRQENLKRMLDASGLDEIGHNRLLATIQGVIDSYEEVYQVTKAFGINVGDSSELINYLPRNFSPEARRRIAWKKLTPTDYMFFGPNAQKTESIYSMFSRGRVTNHYIPEDSVVLDFLLTNADSKIYEKLGVDGIEDVITDSGKFADSFVKYLDESNPYLFDRLVEEGIISKLPMTTYEVYNYMTSKYRLPFNKLSEFTATDFETAGRLYRNQLEQLAGRSIASQYLAASAIEGGWGITRAEKAANPVSYDSFIPLVAGEGDDIGVIPKALAQRFGLDTELHRNTFIHPIAAKFYEATIDLGTDPELLGLVGKMVNDFHSTWVGQALATSGFVARQIINIAVQTHAAGGNIFNYARNVTRTLTQMGIIVRQGLTMDSFADVFDDTVPRYRIVLDGVETEITEKALWNYLRANGTIDEIMPFTGEPVNAANYRPRAGMVEAVTRQARYASSVLKASELSPPEKLINLYGQLSTASRNASERFFYSFQLMNSLLDQVARFSAIQSLTTNATWERATRAAQGNIRLRRMTVGDATNHVENYFFRYDDLGRTQGKMRALIPFFSFVSKNTFATFRMMVRNPSRFVAYNRLYAALNEPAAQEGEDLPEAGVRGWLQNTNPVYWISKDTGNVIAFPTTTLDPVQDGQKTVFAIADDLLSLFGVESGAKSTDDKLSELPHRRTVTSEFFTDMLDRGFPEWEILYGLVTNENLRGYELSGANVPDTSFLGIRMPVMTRFIVETSLPLLRNVNRSNPFYVFGRPPRFDPQTGELLEKPIPAWITGAERSRQDYTADFRSHSQRMLSAAGLNSYIVDVAYEMGKSETSVDIELYQLDDAIAKKEQRITQLTDPQAIAQEYRELEEMRMVFAQMLLDFENFRAWREARGLEHPAAIRQFRQEELTREQVRVLSEEEEYELLKRIYGDVLP